MPLSLPEELYIEVTNRCNSRCETCVHTYLQPEPLRDMQLGEFKTLVDQVPQIRRVVLHGVGEPLLNQDLPAMISYLKQRSNPPHVLFNSNAILLTAERQKALVHAGLDEYRISTDAAHRELYARIRGVDGFDRMVENVAAFHQRIEREARGPRLSLWLTAVRENLAEMSALVRLAHCLGVAEVYVQRLVYHNHGLAQEEQAIFRSMQAAEESHLAEAEAEAERLGITLRASGATTPRWSLLSTDDDEKPWAQCRRPSTLMYITANGNVLPCCLSPFTTGAYNSLILGDAFRTPLSEIWNGAQYGRFRAALQTETPWEACDRCGVLWSL